MNSFYEGEISQALIPLLEPVVMGLTKSSYVSMYLGDRGQTLTLADIRQAGINPERTLSINESLSQTTIDFLNRDLPPGNNKSEVVLSPLLGGKQEADIRAFTLQQYWEGSTPISHPLQQLLDNASSDVVDMKGMIVANGTRYNYGHHPNIRSIYEDTPSIDSLPIEKPDIYYENGTYATFFALPIESESTKLRLFPGGFPRNPHISPRTDWYVVTTPEANTEIAQFVDKSPALQMYFHGLTLASNQDMYVQQLKSQIIKAFRSK